MLRICNFKLVTTIIGSLFEKLSAIKEKSKNHLVCTKILYIYVYIKSIQNYKKQSDEKHEHIYRENCMISSIL